MLAIDLLQAQDVCPQALELRPQGGNAVIESNRSVRRQIQAVDFERSYARRLSCPQRLATNVLHDAI